MSAKYTAGSWDELETNDRAIARSSSHFVLKLVNAGQFEKEHKKEKIINEESRREMGAELSLRIKTCRQKRFDCCGCK